MCANKCYRILFSHNCLFIGSQSYYSRTENLSASQNSLSIYLNAFPVTWHMRQRLAGLTRSWNSPSHKFLPLCPNAPDLIVGNFVVWICRFELCSTFSICNDGKFERFGCGDCGCGISTHSFHVGERSECQRESHSLSPSGFHGDFFRWSLSSFFGHLKVGIT